MSWRAIRLWRVSRPQWLCPSAQPPLAPRFMNSAATTTTSKLLQPLKSKLNLAILWLLTMLSLYIRRNSHIAYIYCYIFIREVKAMHLCENDFARWKVMMERQMYIKVVRLFYCFLFCLILVDSWFISSEIGQRDYFRPRPKLIALVDTDVDVIWNLGTCRV